MCPMAHLVHLVMGISSVGKSTYIQSRVAGGEWEGMPVLMAHEITKKPNRGVLQADCVVHYNLFRPFRNRASRLSEDLLSDAALVQLLDHGTSIDAYALVARPAEIGRRCRQRTTVEPELRLTTNPYPKGRILELLGSIDLPALHVRWFVLLRERDVRFTILDSSSPDYPVLSEDQALALLSDVETP